MVENPDLGAPPLDPGGATGGATVFLKVALDAMGDGLVGAIVGFGVAKVPLPIDALGNPPPGKPIGPPGPLFPLSAATMGPLLSFVTVFFSFFPF